MKEAREPWLRRGFDSLSICFCALADGVVAVCMQVFSGVLEHHGRPQALRVHVQDRRVPSSGGGARHQQHC